MKLKLSNFIYGLLLILIIINTKIFMFGDWDTYLKIITILLTLILFLIIITNQRAHRIISKYKILNLWQVLFWTLFLINIIVSHNTYDTKIIYMISQSYHYIILLLVYPILYLLENNDIYYDKVVNALYYAGIGAIVLRIVVWLFYNYLEIDIMHYILYEAGYDWIRNGRQRIPLPCFTCFVYIKALIEFMSEKNRKILNKIMSSIIILLVIFYSTFIVNARSLVLILGACFIFVYWYSDKSSARRIVKVLIVCCIAIVFLAFSNVTSNYINSIDNWSIIARQQEFEYFYNLFIKNMEYGISFISESVELERGSGGYFYFVDLGIISKFVEYGLLLGMLFIAPIIRMVIKAITIKIKNYNRKLLLIGISIYTLMSAILSADPYFVRNIFILPFELAFLEYISIKRKQL